MIIIPFRFQGVYEITLTPNFDHRGHFTRLYDQQTFKENGLEWNWVQENRSYTAKKGTIRGLHFQLPPYTETKLIRVSKGAIYDVFVDVRKHSPTFGQWDAVLLTEKNNKLLYLAQGFAHGFCSLTDDCELIYKVDNFYAPRYEGGIIWNDETLRINWPILKPILSDKDKRLPPFQDIPEIL